MVWVTITLIYITLGITVEKYLSTIYQKRRYYDQRYNSGTAYR